jgi:putative oxidoreductase
MTTQLDTRLAALSAPALTLFRVVFGLLFFFRGTMKLFGFPFGTAIPVGTWPLWWAGLIETVLAALITIGLFTRISAFIVSGEMAVAYFWMHFPKGFWPYAANPDGTGGNGGEPTIMYCFAFLLLAAIGGGAYSVDARRRTGTVAKRTAAPRRGFGRFRR